MKLSPEQVDAMRGEYLLGGLVGELSEKYGVSERHTRRLVAGEE